MWPVFFSGVGNNEDVTDESLVSCRGISETKWHNLVFKMAKRGIECRFPIIAFFNTNEVVCSL